MWKQKPYYFNKVERTLSCVTYLTFKIWINVHTICYSTYTYFKIIMGFSIRDCVSEYRVYMV